MKCLTCYSSLHANVERFDLKAGIAVGSQRDALLPARKEVRIGKPYDGAARFAVAKTKKKALPVNPTVE
jgi:hypothetical protein